MKSKLPEREYRRQRKNIWQSMNGCDCAVDLPRQDRCTADAVRCNGRLRVVTKRMRALCRSQDRCLMKGCKGSFEHKGRHDIKEAARVRAE